MKIGCGDIAATLWLPALVADIKRALPNVTLEIDVDLTFSLHQKIEAGSIDVALIGGPTEGPSLLARRIARIDMAWYGSHAMAERLDDQSDWTSIPVWTLSRPSHLFHVMAEALRNAKLNSPAMNTCNTVHTLIDIVASGAGIAILPSAMVRHHVEQGELVRIAAFLPEEPVDFFAVVRRSEEEPIVLNIFNRLQAASASNG